MKVAIIHRKDLATKQKGKYQIFNHPSMFYIIIGYKLKTKYRNVAFCR